MPLNQKELASALGVSRSQITRYKKLGMQFPISVEDAKLWREATLSLVGEKPGRKTEEFEPDLTIESLDYQLPDGQDPADTLQRLRNRERSLYAQVEAIEQRLQTKPSSRLAAKLPSIRKEYKDVARLTIAVHKLLIDIGESGRENAAMDAADRYINCVLRAVLFRFKNLHFELPVGQGREQAFEKIRDTFATLPVLVPQFLHKSGMEKLYKRAAGVIETARVEVEADKTAPQPGGTLA
jgi:hypothetical protein